MKMKNIQQIYEQFLQFESEKNLFENLKIENIKIWHYIRYEIYDVVTHTFGVVSNPNSEKMFYYERNSLKDWIDENICKNQLRIRHKNILIFNHTRRIKQDKYYKCAYTDEWLSDFKKDYYVYERSYTGRFHFKPVITKNLRYIDIERYSKLFHKNYFSGLEYQKKIREVSAYIVSLLEEEFEIILKVTDKKKIFHVVINCILTRDILRDYYGYLIKRIRPKIIIYIVGYGYENMILAELGKEFGVPTVEIEHGHIGSGHLAYNFIDNVKSKCFPDYLFVVGQHEVDAMRFPIPKENIYITGSPELDLKVNYYSKNLLNKKKKKKIITFISGGEFEIADAAMELYQKIDRTKYKVYFKLHPSEYTNWKRKYQGLENSGVQIVDDSRHDIYYYLAVSDFLIGINSTVLYEATRFSCDIMIYRKGDYFNSNHLIHSEQGNYIDSMDEAIDRIYNFREKRKKSEYFYCENSCQHIYDAIDDIIEKRYKEG